MIYLDNAATTPVNSKVALEVMNTMLNTWGNPSSTHELGLAAKQILEDARKEVGDYIHASQEEIIFTSGACESNALALNMCNNHKYRLIISSIEHKSIDSNPHVDYRIKVDKDGFVDLTELQQVCIQTCAYNQIPVVSIQWANGEIGTIQNIKKISEIVHSYNGILHTDATQMMADRYINVKETNVDLLSFSGQKIGAPKGIGALYIKQGIFVLPIIYGSQEFGLRGGTENLPYIVGLKTALKVHDFVNPDTTNYFIQSIKNNFDFAIINGAKDCTSKLSNIISVTFKGFLAEDVLAMFTSNEEKVYASMGAACENHSITTSRILKAIGLTDEEAKSTIRFSFNADIKIEDINFVIRALKNTFFVFNFLNTAKED